MVTLGVIRQRYAECVSKLIPTLAFHKGDDFVIFDANWNATALSAVNQVPQLLKTEKKRKERLKLLAVELINRSTSTVQLEQVPMGPLSQWLSDRAKTRQKPQRQFPN